MQLGTRWRAGEPPHRGVPETLHAAIAEQETLHPAAAAWTLTWLEGRPRCSLDDIVTLTLTGEGEVRAEDERSGFVADDEGDDWLDGV